jgi:hypothetical protein
VFADPVGHPFCLTTWDTVPGSEPAGEATVLVDHLDGQRRHVLGILEGLDDEALRRPVLPSGWSCLGLVRHLTVGIERFWFLGVVAGDQGVRDELVVAAGDGWTVAADVPAATVLDAYRDEVARANAVIAGARLDASPAWWPVDLFGSWRLDDVRAVVLHVLTETACHAGHLDAVRELLDGRSWRVGPG